MYRALFCSLFLSFQVFSQQNFGWVGLNNETNSYYFPNVEGIFAESLDGSSIRCGVSEYTETLNVLTDQHYDLGRTGCHGFITPEGEYGPYGHQVVNHIKTYPYDQNEFLKNKFPGMTDGLKICPNWKNLTLPQKFDFWVWVFASIAWDESRCLPNRVNRRASDGVAVGLFQLNKKQSQRYWRGGKDRKACAVKDISSDLKNIECSVEIMHEVLRSKKGEYKGNGAVYGKKANTYWESFRNDGGRKAIKLLNKFQPCQKSF